MFDVITVGSSTVDVFAKVDSELIKIKTVHHEEELIAYPSGSKILINNLYFLTGGGGTNTAVALSRLGLKVAYLGKIGQDANAEMILKTLKKDRVRFIGAAGEGSSGYSIILDSLEGDRTILTHKGVNNDLALKDIDKKKLKAKWFYFSSMVGESYRTLEELARFAQKNHIKVAFNPSNYLAEKGPVYLKEVLSRTDLLILNKEEATLIAGDGSALHQIRVLMGYGAKQVVITHGNRGVYALKGERLLHLLPNDIEVKETTGAGDAFASTFLAGVVLGKNLEACLRMGLVNAESVIQKMGAKNGLLRYSSLMAKLRKNPPRIN